MEIGKRVNDIRKTFPLEQLKYAMVREIDVNQYVFMIIRVNILDVTFFNSTFVL